MRTFCFLLVLIALPVGCRIDEDGDGWSPQQGDCDDTDPDRHPGMEEACNRIDDDCDGTTDESDDIDPLPPGTYGLEDAHARIVADGIERLFGGVLLSTGDMTGDGADEFVTNAPCYGCLGLHAAGFCPGEFGASDRYAEFGSQTSGYYGHLGDVDGDGRNDATLAGAIYLSPLYGLQSEPDYYAGSATSMQAADLDRDGHPDLIVGSTFSGEVRFHRGPFNDGDLGPAVSVQGYAFGDGLAVLPAHEPPVTLISTGSAVRAVLGLPTEDQEGGEPLNLTPLFGPDAVYVGKGLASDGFDRICVGTDGSHPPLVVCGTLAELEGGAPELVIEPRAGTETGNLGPAISMTRDLVAVGHAFATVDSDAGAGLVYVRGDAGAWDFEWDGPTDVPGLGRAVALLRDPVARVTWLAASAPRAGDGGIIYLFALDVPPTME